MRIDKNTSERLSALRFPLIIGVVFIHAFSPCVEFPNAVVGLSTQGYLSDLIQSIVSQGFSRIAVPLFFLISGYLYFLGFSWSLENFKMKVASRYKTLMLPFLFWNILTLILIALGQILPVTKDYFSNDSAQIASFSIYEYVNAIFGLTRAPISYQFWFIRDLMLLFLLTPIIYSIARIQTIFLPIIIFLLWFINYWPITIPSVTAFTFFYAGAYFVYSKISLFWLDRYGVGILILYLLVLVADTFSKGYEVNQYVHNMGLILGMGSALYTSKFMVKIKSLKKVLLAISGSSFFVFAVHEPMLTIIKKVVYRAVEPTTAVIFLLLYLTIPVLVITSALLMYMALRNVMPRSLRVISGKRGV